MNLLLFSLLAVVGVSTGQERRCQHASILCPLLDIQRALPSESPFSSKPNLPYKPVITIPWQNKESVVPNQNMESQNADKTQHNNHAFESSHSEEESDSLQEKVDQTNVDTSTQKNLPNKDNIASTKIIQSVLGLSQNLLQKILSKSSKKYEVVSPISLSSAIQLALLGSHGETYNELITLLKLDDFTYPKHQIHDEFGKILSDLVTNEPRRNHEQVPWRKYASEQYKRKSMKYQSRTANDSEHKIEVANGIFVTDDFNLRPDYVNVVKKVYNSEIRQMDFRGKSVKSAQEINQWVNDKTHGKIKEILPTAINPNTKVILTNALYFKAEWQVSFIEGATSKKKFFTQGRNQSGTFIETDMMAHGGLFPHHYDPELDCEILGLPYKQNATTMYVIMPKTSNPDSLRKLQEKLTAEKFEAMVNQMSLKTAVILFPKMHLTSGLHLKTELKELGAKSLFDFRKSDLSVLAADEQGEEPSGPTFSGASRDVASRNHKRETRDVKYKVESEYDQANPLSMKDFVLKKRIVKKNQQGKKLKRSKRQSSSEYTKNLEDIRGRQNLKNPGLFAEEVIHKVDLTINEKGTEGGAATAITLNRSGTNVVFRVDAPFMFIVRHDPTHIPLFYGVVFEPEN